MKSLFKPSSPAGVGGPTVVVVFIILCLTLFSVLSLAVASGQQNLTRRSLESIQRYYAADGQAQSARAWLAQISRDAAAQADPLSRVEAQVAAREDMTASRNEDGLQVIAVYPAQGRLELKTVFLVEADGGVRLVKSILTGSTQTGEAPLPSIWQPTTAAAQP
jgi:hypothetical protein